MSVSMKLLGLDRLTPDERVMLANELYESLAAEIPPVLSDAMKQELDRRAEEDEAHPETGVPWDEVDAKLRARYPS